MAVISSKIILKDHQWRQDISAFLVEILEDVDSVEIDAIPIKNMIVVQIRTSYLQLPILLRMSLDALKETTVQDIVSFIISKIPENMFSTKNISKFINNFMESEFYIMFLNIEHILSVKMLDHDDLDQTQILFKDGGHIEIGKIHYNKIISHMESIGRYDVLL